MAWSGLIRPPQLQHSDTDAGTQRTATWLELFFDLAFLLVVAELAVGFRNDLDPARRAGVRRAVRQRVVGVGRLHLLCQPLRHRRPRLPAGQADRHAGRGRAGGQHHRGDLDPGRPVRALPGRPPPRAGGALPAGLSPCGPGSKPHRRLSRGRGLGRDAVARRGDRADPTPLPLLGGRGRGRGGRPHPGDPAFGRPASCSRSTSQNASGSSSSWCSANQSPRSPSASTRPTGSPTTVTIAVLGFVVAASLWWIYFDLTGAATTSTLSQSCLATAAPPPRHLRLRALAHHPRARPRPGSAWKRPSSTAISQSLHPEPAGCCAAGSPLYLLAVTAIRVGVAGSLRKGPALARGRRTAHPRCRPGQPRSPGRRGGCRDGRARQRGGRRPRHTTPGHTQHSSARERTVGWGLSKCRIQQGPVQDCLERTVLLFLSSTHPSRILSGPPPPFLIHIPVATDQGAKNLRRWSPVLRSYLLRSSPHHRLVGFFFPPFQSPLGGFLVFFSAGRSYVGSKRGLASRSR